MIPYKNLAGDSGVVAYELTDDSIVVEFEDGHIYLYNYSRPGKYLVDQMRSLALRGQGLSTLISKTVRKQYARKIR